MDLDTLIIRVFCHIDDALTACLAGVRLRTRGPKPILLDCEVLTMEVVGQYLGFSQDKAIFDYFRRHYSHFFPCLASVHRTTFTRQSANLWRIKEAVWQHLVQQHVSHDPSLALIDSFPMPVCAYARAAECKRLRDISAFGRDGCSRAIFWGLRVHARVCWPGVITRLELAPANVAELHLVGDLAEHSSGMLVGDRNYWGPAFARQLREEQGVELVAPYRKSSQDPHPRKSRVLSRTRQSIEVVFGHLCERFKIKRMWARDIWHLSSRVLRALLTHTVCLLLNQLQGNSVHPLNFAQLLTP
jgi:hypothetical protein